jgi:hypothetical protein
MQNIKPDPLAGESTRQGRGLDAWSSAIGRVPHRPAIA